MKNLSLLAAMFYLATLSTFQGSVSAQEPTSAPDDVIRTDVRLVQSAVTVLDKAGHFVEGLRQDEFELLIDGKPRPISFFERITAGSPREREVLGNANRIEPETSDAPAPTVVGRSIVFFIDDLHLEPDSLNRTRRLLKHFLGNEMGSQDNVAIVSASGQIGFLEQFTNNKEILEAAISRLAPRPYVAEGYNVGSSTKMSEFMALTIDTGRSDNKVLTFFVEECMKGANAFGKGRLAALVRASCETQVKNSARAILAQSAQITQNTYHSLESLMRSSARMPGRKLAFFVSDGFLLDAGPHAPAVRDKFDHVIDAAQRAGVVIYTIHAKGLVNSSFMDVQNNRPLDPNGRLDIASVGELQATQDALHALASDTGGQALRNINFFEQWVGESLNQTSNYYLFAWRPETQLETTEKFRNVKISVKARPDLTVRAPRGYVEGPKSEIRVAKLTSTPKTSDGDIRDALTDYYPASEIKVQLSLTYLSTPANGLVLTSSLHVAGNDISYGVDGKPAAIRLAGVVLNDAGKVTTNFGNQLNVNPLGAGSIDTGLFYTQHSPVMPGIYQVRIAVRDEKSQRVGSAMRWIVVPDLNRGQLTLSSLLLGGHVVEDKTSNGETHVQLSVNHTFSRDSDLSYWLFVYNAKRDAKGSPHLTAQTMILRNGKVALTGREQRVDSAGADPARIPIGDKLPLKTLNPGRYDLAVTLKDAVANTSVTQNEYFIVR